jgi:hypothetical protein
LVIAIGHWAIGHRDEQWRNGAMAQWRNGAMIQ